MFVIHFRLVVLVAGKAGETGIIVRVLVALYATVPFPPVLARINGEIQAIVAGEIGRAPARIGGMTEHAIGGKTRSLVGRIARGLVIVLVTGVTFGRCARKITRGMTAVAILDIMSLCKREELVRKTCSSPGIGVQAMAVCAFSTYIGCRMVGCGCCHVFVHVAIHTFNSHGFEAEPGSRLVTAGTLGC